MKTPLTNTQLIQDIMDFSPTGALAQLFVIQALSSYAQRIADLPPERLSEMFPPSSLLSGPAWKATAEHILSKLNAPR